MTDASETLGAPVEDLRPALYPDDRELIGRHVTLRRIQEADMEALWLAIGVHGDLWLHWPDGPYKDLEAFTEMMHGLLGLRDLVAYMVLQEGKIGGCLLLQPADLESRVMEMGLFYGPSLSRTRAGTEGLYLLTCLVFDELRNRRLEWKTSLANVPSNRAAERYGFTFEGRLRQHRIQKGRNRDTIWYGIIDSEWPACKRAFELWLDDANFDAQGMQKRKLADIRKEILQGQ